MAEYIEREAVLAFLEENHTDRDWLVNQYNADWICSWIESQPAADVVEVKHGRWLPCGFGKEIMCSVCKGELDDVWEYRHCPNCGARKDGGDDA